MTMRFIKKRERQRTGSRRPPATGVQTNTASDAPIRRTTSTGAGLIWKMWQISADNTVTYCAKCRKMDNVGTKYVNLIVSWGELPAPSLYLPDHQHLKMDKIKKTDFREQKPVKFQGNSFSAKVILTEREQKIQRFSSLAKIFNII